MNNQLKQLTITQQRLKRNLSKVMSSIELEIAKTDRIASKELYISKAAIEKELLDIERKIRLDKHLNCRISNAA